MELKVCVWIMRTPLIPQFQKIIFMTIIETPRLILRQFTTADAPFVLALLNSDGWLQFIGDRGVRTLEDAEKYIADKFIGSYAANGFGLYEVILKSENTPIGMCGLVNREGLEGVDIGFAMLPGFAGKGHAFEAASATLEFAKTKIGLKRVLAITMETNVRSIKLLERIGLRFDGKIMFGEEELMLYAG